jgi:hypothetical protein
MKKILLLLFALPLTATYAQNNIAILYKDYIEMKKNGQLDVTKNYQFTDAVAPAGPPVKYTSGERTPSTICSCLLPLDSTFSYVPFVSYSSDPTMAVYGATYMNDDASSSPITLPFSFNFYGVNYNTVFINNNGNISFNTYYSQFTANPFPDPSYNMIAPFWADVDTRDFSSGSGGAVLYKMTPTALIVRWLNVGYYNMHFDKLNSFQLIITNGSDPLLPPGTNVGYCYDNMEWTTGDVTGAGGYGSPATVGVNQGNGVDYFQAGTFNHPSNFFDGPYNSPDGVHWLDNNGMYFDVATIGNLPPVIINNNICDTIDVYTGDTLAFLSEEYRVMTTDTVRFMIGVSTPEISQNVTAAFTCTADSSHFSAVMTMNTPTYKLYECTFIARDIPLGYYYITVTATDDGSPVKSSSQTIVIRSMWDPGITTGLQENKDLPNLSVYPNPASDQVQIRHNMLLSDKPVMKIYSQTGQLIATKVVTATEITVDLSGYNSGLYNIVLQDKNGSQQSSRLIRR